MSFDGLFTHAMVHELNETLQNGRISKIYQPYNNEIVLRIRANRKNHDVLISAHPQYSRIQITETPFENPKQPPHFCMIMRKYLESAFLKEIKQFENDRIVEFNFTSRDELGDEQEIVLISEIMGRHSNILLVEKNKNKIIDTIRHISPSQNSYRTLLPGAEFIPAPAQDNVNPFEFEGEFNLQGHNTKEKVKDIQSTFQGFSRIAAKELLYQIDQHPDDAATNVFHKFMTPFVNNNYDPSLFVGEKNSFAPIEFESIDKRVEHYESLSALLDRFYYNKAEKDRVNQQVHDLISLVKNSYQKNKKKLDKIEKEYEQTKYADDYRVKGEVLTAYLHEVNQGDKEIELANFYENNEPILIELDPQKSPADNAQKYFSRYQKMKNRKKQLSRQIKLTKNEVYYLDSVLTQLEDATTEDIEEIRDELRQEGYGKKKQKNKSNKNKKSKESKPRHFESSDGTLIMVGKNNRQNDKLTMRTANKTDWWLHTKNIPGSHVIIRSEDPSEETIEEAANLAAYYSKYRSSSSVPVDIVQVKYVNKPKGGKPGFVTYEGQDTYFVTPSEELVNRLQAD